jgi:drug/metabolite transporter (DMT)-like permease
MPAALFFLTGFFFGMAKPVPVNFSRLHKPKRDMVWVGAASFVLLSLPSGNPLSTLSTHLTVPVVLFSVVYMAVFGSIIGATTYLVGQNLIEISEASIFTYLQPVVAIPLSILWLKESLSPITILGMLIIGVGVYLSEFRRS